MSTTKERLFLNPVDKGDLYWFFNEAKGELGLRAQSYEPTYSMFDVAHLDPHTEARLKAIARYRSIERSIQALTYQEQKILLRWFVQAKQPHRLKIGFGAWACLATLTSLYQDMPKKNALKAVEDLCFEAFFSKEASVPARALITSAKAEAQALLRNAVQKYSAIRAQHAQEPQTKGAYSYETCTL